MQICHHHDFIEASLRISGISKAIATKASLLVMPLVVVISHFKVQFTVTSHARLSELLYHEFGRGH